MNTDLLTSVRVPQNGTVPMDTKHIMIIDDEEDHRMLLGDLLESKGYTISVAENAKQALDMLSFQPVDLVITDFMMPGMNGLELIRAMANRPWLDMIPVILLTANQRENLEELARSAGALATVFKPYDFKRFLALVHSAIGQEVPPSTRSS